MDLRKLRVGEWIAATSGVLLIVALLLPWWSFDTGPDYPDGSVSFTLSAWEALSVIDVLLCLLGVLAVGVLCITAAARAASPSVAAEALLTPFALAMVVVCLLRILNVPYDYEIGASVGGEVTAGVGAWLSLGATVGVLVGVLVGMRDERLSKPGRLTDSTGVPVERAVEVEKLPAPPPA